MAESRVDDIKAFREELKQDCVKICSFVDNMNIKIKQKQKEGLIVSHCHNFDFKLPNITDMFT